jgi:putative colanic acid biosynthesis glycosyltransferase
MTQISIAVVTVCLNDRAGLEATFESLRDQSVAAAQWIVVDAGSTDGTREWLESQAWFALSWSSEPDSGIFDGMNKGLRRVTCDYVLFLNSGDTLADSTVLATVALALGAVSPPASLLFGDSFEVDLQGRRHLRRARRPGWIRIGMPTTHQAMYFRVAAMPAFDTNYVLSGDYAVVARLYRRHDGTDFVYLPRTLCNFRLGGRSTTQWQQLHREHTQIRRSILAMGRPSTTVLQALHHVHRRVKQYAPALHRLFRYG